MNKPYVICHMLTSLDGKIDGTYMNMPECLPSLEAYGNIREFFQCQAILYGTTTMAGKYADGFVKKRSVSDPVYSKEDYVVMPHADAYIISVDPQGVLNFRNNFIKQENRPKAHVVEVLTEAVTNNYLDYLHKRNISYIFARKDHLNCTLMLNKLHNLFSIERLMIAGGGLTNWSFVQENLMDELSLVVAPVADGNTTAVSIFERANFLPPRVPVAFRLKEVKPLAGDALWLRYTVK